MKKLFEITVVSLVMSGLALFSTFPLLKHFTTAIPWTAFRRDISWTLLNHPGDHLQVFYFFWLVKQNLLGRVPLNGNPYEFNMLDGASAANDGLTTAPLAFINFLFTPFGDIAAYNCTIISSCVLAGVFMYLLARMMSPSRAAAFLAAVIFTFIPFRISGLGGGNQYAFVLFMYPMIFYFMEKCLQVEKVRYSILAGLALVGLSFNEPHLIYYLYMGLGGYLPIRLISLMQVSGGELPDEHRFVPGRVATWPPWLSLLIIYLAGVAIALYVHCAVPLYPGESFFSKRMWITVGYYPLIILFTFILLAVAVNHLSKMLCLRQALALEAVSSLVLYLFFFLAIIHFGKGPQTTSAIVYSIVAVVLANLFLLRSFLRDMAGYLWHNLKIMKSRLLIFSPVILFLIGNGIFTVIVKKSSMAPSTVSDGRTLMDVKTFSAQLQDVLQPTSSVFIGLLPAIFALVFLGYLLGKMLRSQNPWSGQRPTLVLLVFWAVVLLVSYALAMGLSLGNRSLYILFFEYVPFFNVPRVSDRIVSVSIFVLACIAASVGGRFVTMSGARLWKICSTSLIVALTIFQLKSYSVGMPMALTNLQPMEEGYRYIKENIGDGLLLELPLWPGDSHQSSVYEYYSTLDTVKRVNGYSPLVAKEYVRTIFNPLHSLDRGFLRKEQYELLRKLKVEYITVHEHRDIFTAKVSPNPPQTTVRRLQMSPFLDFVGAYPIINKKYDKLHERLFIFRVRKDVSSGKENDFYTLPTIYRPGGYLRQQTGRVEEDRDTGRKVYHALPGRDTPGYLTYGPYRSFFAAAYRSSFYLKCETEDIGLEAGVIDVVRLVDEEPDTLASAQLGGDACDGTYRRYDLEFAIHRRERLGFRLFYSGSAEIALEKVVVARKSVDTIPRFLEAEKLPGAAGYAVDLETASGSRAVEAQVGMDRKGKMVYGPGKNLARGRYSAVFHLRLPRQDLADVKENQSIALLAVVGDQAEEDYARRVVRLKDLQEDKWQEIRLDFTLAAPDELTYTVHFNNRATIQLDGIEIANRNGSLVPGASSLDLEEANE